MPKEYWTNEAREREAQESPVNDSDIAVLVGNGNKNEHRSTTLPVPEIGGTEVDRARFIMSRRNIGYCAGCRQPTQQKRSNSRTLCITKFCRKTVLTGTCCQTGTRSKQLQLHGLESVAGFVCCRLVLGKNTIKRAHIFSLRTGARIL